MIVAIEGVDGSGKTTQAKLLVEKLQSAGFNAVYIRPLFVFIKEDSQRPNISPRQARTGNSKTLKRIVLAVPGYIYAFACYLAIRYWLGRGKISVCDRYFYQFFFDLFGSFGLKVAGMFPKPDIVFFLRGELSIFFSRMDSSFDKTIDKSYYETIIKLYDSLSEKYGFIEINADCGKEEISDVIFKHSLEKLG